MGVLTKRSFRTETHLFVARRRRLLPRLEPLGGGNTASSELGPGGIHLLRDRPSGTSVSEFLARELIDSALMQVAEHEGNL